MTADEFLTIPDDGYNYELIDGVVIMSPSPSPKHQAITSEILAQIHWYLRTHRLGRVFAELDVHLGTGPTGGDLVYKPEVIFIRSERRPEMLDKIAGAPELVVEVISRGSRRLDSQTKKADYERFGVQEYWLADPERKRITFYRLIEGRFEEVSPAGTAFTSRAVPGFVLDLTPIHELFGL
jgi:Uma2 family endonuclease